jgi:predicted acylesterase/phospholipase RssA
MRYNALPQARDLPRPNHQRPSIRPPFECIALLLQGGGALGSYQAGVHEALAEADLHPDWVAGISIGAVNSALIAGNSPGERVAKLRSFWQEVTANPLLDWSVALESLSPRGDYARGLFNQLLAVSALTRGAPISSSSVSRSHGCTRRARLRRPASTIPSTSRPRSRASSTSSIPGRRASASAPSTFEPATSTIWGRLNEFKCHAASTQRLDGCPTVAQRPVR